MPRKKNSTSIKRNPSTKRAQLECSLLRTLKICFDSFFFQLVLYNVLLIDRRTIVTIKLPRGVSFSSCRCSFLDFRFKCCECNFSPSLDCFQSFGCSNISGRKCRPVYKICALHVRCDFCLVLVKYFLLLLFLVLVLPWPILIKAPFSAFSYIGVSVFARKMGEFPKNERRLYNSIGRHHISFLFLTCRIFNPRRLRSVFV